MNFNLLSFLLFTFFISFFWNPSFGQDRINETFIGNNEGLLQIVGTAQNYAFISQQVSARIDIGQNLMEFIIPLKSFVPLEDLEHEKIISDVFSSPFALPLYLTATFDNQTIGRENFSKPFNVILNGVLSLYDEQFQVPVEVSFYNTDEKIFYNMSTRFDLKLLNRNYEGIYKEIITGEFVIIVKDAQWVKGVGR